MVQGARPSHWIMSEGWGVGRCVGGPLRASRYGETDFALEKLAKTWPGRGPGLDEARAAARAKSGGEWDSSAFAAQPLRRDLIPVRSHPAIARVQFIASGGGWRRRVGFEPTVEFPLHTLSKRAFDRSSISPFRINNLQSCLKGNIGDCDKSLQCARSLTGFSSIAASLPCSLRE